MDNIILSLSELITAAADSMIPLYVTIFPKASLRIRLFNVFIKLLSCVLYCVRVVNDSRTLPPFVTPKERPEGEIRYEYLIWVDRNDYLWLAQTIVAFISIAETIIIFYISYQRGGERQFDLFTSFYFVMVTFSTVGYGDWYPDTWMSRLCVVSFICVALVLLPSQIEALGQTWLERQKSGGDYGGGWSRNEKHVVVTITHLEVEFIRDFLDEFYAHPENQDEHTILRSWAVKDFAPHVKQYVQIFRAETKMHIEHAGNNPSVPDSPNIHEEVLICEDEFKYSLLANNCICPGISTFITLLMHTSRGEEGKKSTEPWHKVYGFHSGNEIYMIRAEDSKFFGDFIGKSFTYASFHAHRTYGIGLIGLKTNEPNAKIRLNPGVSHVLQGTDILYYMGLTNEESLYDFRKDLKDQRRKANLASTIANIGTVAIDVPNLEEGLIKKPKLKKRGLLQKTKATDEVRLIDVPANGSRRPSIAMVMEGKGDSSSDSEHEEACTKCNGPCIQQKIQRTYPQVRTYIGTSNTVCHMLKEKRPLCCLQLDKACEHCPYTSAYEYSWTNKPIILAADRTSSGMYNLIIPLRAYYRPVHELHPIVLLLELEETASPNPAFLDAVSYFPGIYWMQGKISVLDNLLRAGVSRAEHVVVVKETASLAEEHFADCNTIITVQKIHRMFPRLRMITELTHASNMRFVQFDAHNPYSLAQSRFEKKERKRGSHMPFMFRLPFAQGGVFSANMLDRLLYQAIIKPYVVSLTRLLLGIDQTADSGYLTSVTNRLLVNSTRGVVYSHKVSHDMEEKCKSVDLAETARERKKDMYNHIRSRMRNMGMSMDDEC
ncbi:Calcium-activated BK potassium channel alpha subunit [Ancylostoma duodenale]|uniref:Calcium-activated BK potassium channel alpha subunit n=1 Tax=Ancylostoma duodenale TaxID=51022 RepID=A0A0C2GIP4_9BILA|nr:Calcium-activated BK potassium channel alpha subunit [Ancylostoma duodenale]